MARQNVHLAAGEISQCLAVDTPARHVGITGVVTAENVSRQNLICGMVVLTEPPSNLALTASRKKINGSMQGRFMTRTLRLGTPEKMPELNGERDGVAYAVLLTFLRITNKHTENMKTPDQDITSFADVIKQLAAQRTSIVKREQAEAREEKCAIRRAFNDRVKPLVDVLEDVVASDSHSREFYAYPENSEYSLKYPSVCSRESNYRKLTCVLTIQDGPGETVQLWLTSRSRRSPARLIAESTNPTDLIPELISRIADMSVKV